MDYNQLSSKIIGAAIKVHSVLGPGLLESVYEEVMRYELMKNGFCVECQKYLPIKYEELVIEDRFRLDMIVDDSIILEFKSVKAINDVHLKQLLTYLKLSDKRLGLLINFNEVLLKDGVRRVVNNF